MTTAFLHVRHCHEICKNNKGAKLDAFENIYFNVLSEYRFNAAPSADNAGRFKCD